MTEFVFGESSAQKTEHLLGRINDRLSEGKNIIVVIPEQQALYWDTLAASRIRPEDTLKIETVSFTRLADIVFRRFGGIAKNYITDAEKTLIMWNSLVSVAPQLKIYGALERSERYVPMLRRAVSEMKLYGVTPSELESAADELEASGRRDSLCSRLRDLSVIAAAYDTVLHECYDDPEEIPDALCDMLTRYDFFENTAVFIDGFYTLTPKEMKVCEQILRSDADICITFAQTNSSHTKSDRIRYVAEYVRAMHRLAMSAGQKVSITDLKREGDGSTAAYLRENLWNYGAAPLESGGENVTVIKCADRYDEAAACAVRIKELIRGGAHYSDIAVVCADLDILRGITDTELEKNGIPVYVSGKTPVTDQPAMRLLLTASAVAAGGWRRDDVTALASLGLCGLTPDQSDALERYTEIWRIRGEKMFCSDERWNMNPAGYTQDAPNDWNLRLMTLANEAKDILVPPLEAFCSSFGGRAEDICRAAFKLLSDFGVYDTLRTQTEMLAERGEYAAAQKKSQVWGAVCSVLNTVATAVPDARMDAHTFAAMLRKAADACSIGTIPDGIDRVALGSVGSLRLDGAAHVIVLGVKSGEFPAAPKDTGFFSDIDKEELKAVGIELSPSSEDRVDQEMFLFRNTVSSFSETLTVIIPSDENGEMHPSSGALRIIRLLPRARTIDLSSREGTEALRRYGSGEDDGSQIPLCADNDAVSESDAANIFGNRLNMTQSRIECFNGCAFQYYCRYVLHLDEGKTAELSPADVGNFVHKILEEFMKESCREAFPIEEGVLVSRSERLIKEYISSITPSGVGGRLDYLFRRLSRSVQMFARSLSEEFAQSRFVPYKFELKVGFDEDLPSCPIELRDGRVMSVSGIADRVDIYRSADKVYLRVADYKTGSKKFSVSEVMAGRNVQLMLYLFSLCESPKDCSFRRELAPEGERVLPAGAVYFSARPGEAESKSFAQGDAARDIALKDISRSGVVLDERDVIEAMDSEVSGVYAPVKLKADGSYTAASSVVGLDSFKEIKQSMTESLKALGNRMISGEAASEPHEFGGHNPCQYCPSRMICRHSERDTKKDTASNDGAEDRTQGKEQSDNG